MKKLIYLLLLFASGFYCQAQINVTQIEYFIDADLGVGLNPAINVAIPDTDITQTVTIPIPANLSLGYHKLYVRTQDSNGNWSHTVRRNIEMVAPQVQNNNVEGEYYIDSDPEFSLAFPFTISPQDTDITQTFVAQFLPTASIGYHKLYGRVKDSFGNWSHTFRRNVEVVANEDSLYVVEIEYFFEDSTDLGFGNCNKLMVPFNPVADSCWTFNVPYPAGTYNSSDTLFFRVRDSSNNRWSHTIRLDSVSVSAPCVFVSIQNIQPEIKFSLYPNPVSQKLNVGLDKYTEFSFVITDMLGHQIISVTELHQPKQINVEILPAGIYLLTVTTKDGSAVKKFIKQ